MQHYWRKFFHSSRTNQWVGKGREGGRRRGRKDEGNAVQPGEAAHCSNEYFSSLIGHITSSILFPHDPPFPFRPHRSSYRNDTLCILSPILLLLKRHGGRRGGGFILYAWPNIHRSPFPLPFLFLLIEQRRRRLEACILGDGSCDPEEEKQTFGLPTPHGGKVGEFSSFLFLGGRDTRSSCSRKGQAV